MVKYILNGNEVSKECFFKALQGECFRVIHTTSLGNGLGVDVTQFDKHRYRAYQRKLQKGDILLFCGSGNSFRRVAKKEDKTDGTNHNCG